MKRRDLLEKGLTLGALACVPVAWEGERLAPVLPATEGPLWLVPADPWPYFRIYTEYPCPRAAVYPDQWRTERIHYEGDCTQVTLHPYWDPTARRLQLRLPKITDMSWGYGGRDPRSPEGWKWLWVGPGRPWRPPGPSAQTQALLAARFDILMRGQGVPLEQLPLVWWSGYGRVEEG